MEGFDSGYMDINILFAFGRHDGLIFFMEQFVKTAEKNNINYLSVDFTKPESFDSYEIEEFVNRPNVVMFTFNNYGIKFSYSNGENVWKKHNIPVFDYIVDHPRNFDDSMEDPVCDLYVIALDLDHVDFIKRYYSKVKGVYFSPNGGKTMDDLIPYDARNIDVIYMGGCQEKINSYPIINYFKDEGKDFYIRTLEIMFGNLMLPTEKAIETYFEEKNITISDEDLLLLNKKYAVYLENTVRRRTKLMGMKALDDLGVHVEVFGGLGFRDDEIVLSDNIVLHDRISCIDIMEKIKQAKISLCFTPWFKNGCSEKNFDSMLNGALCVTDKGKYLENHYIDGYNIIFFDLSNPTQMAVDIKWLLDNPDQASIIAQRGYETASMYDTWENRFDFVYETMLSVVESRET